MTSERLTEMHRGFTRAIAALALCVLLAAPIVARAESPDFADNISTAQPIPASQPIAGRVSFSDTGGDKDDVFAVRLKKGQWFWARLSADSGTDFDLYLFGPKSPSVESSVPALAASERISTSNEFYQYKASVDATTYVDVFAFNGSGNYQLTYGYPSTEITVTGSAPSRCSWGGSATIKGKVTVRGTGEGVEGERVYVMKKPSGSTSYSFVGYATTRADGSYSFSVKPTRSTRYQVRHLGSEDYVMPVAPASFVVTPFAYLTRPYTPSTVTRGVAWTASGYLRPKHASGAKDVRVRIYKVGSDGKPVWYKTFMATNYTVDGSTTKYKARVYFPSRGKWAIRAVVLGDSIHAETATAFQYRTVR